MKYIALLAAITVPLSHALDCPRIDLKKFRKDPKSFMERQPQKYDEDCNPTKFTLFDPESIAAKDFVLSKDKGRKAFCHAGPKGEELFCLSDVRPGGTLADLKPGLSKGLKDAPIRGLDQPENIVPRESLYRNLKTMDGDGLLSGEVATQPWSDWYWPIAVGQLSYRYNDPAMRSAHQRSGLDDSNTWTWVNDWHVNRGMPEDVNLLSPAEKYDLLMGDSNYTLTKNMLEAGKYYQDNFGKVEGWMGLCHGWAPASYMLPRPSRSVVLRTPGGSELTFLPSDLKALGTLLWSNGKQRNKFVGGRCNVKDPEKDAVTGRILDERCFDTNPGSWHQAVVSHIGERKRPFVMDATYDYEVWNHPVTGYKYQYFNPSTMNYVDSLSEAMVETAGFKNDKFSSYRGEKAVYVAGIVMEVRYLVETYPSSSGTDHPRRDAFNSVQYVYDLELDRDGNIVGGEWYNNKHPDFLWTPRENSRALSVVDDNIRMSRLPLDMLDHPNLLQMAPYASENGQPIGAVVETLLREASR